MREYNTKVLIVGTYCSLNKGDRLMQEVTAALVAESGATPIIASPFPAIDRSVYVDVCVKKSRRRNLPLSVLQIITLLTLPKTFRNKFARNNDELKEYVSAKYIIDVSGDMLTEDYGPHVAISHLIPLIYCVLLDKPFVVLAQSIGPFKRLKYLFKYILQRAFVISTRDQISFDYLKNEGVGNLRNVADLGFLLRNEKTNLDFLTELTSDGKNIVVGICPSALFFEKFKRSNPNINIDTFCSMLDDIARKNNFVYLIIPHVLTPSKKMDDEIFSKVMQEKLNTKSEIVDPRLKPACTKYIASKISVLASFRMHGAIAGIDNNIPTMLVSYSHKAEGLFEKIGMTKYVIKNDDDLIDRFRLCLESLVSEAPILSQHLEKVVPKLRRQAEINKDIIFEM